MGGFNTKNLTIYKTCLKDLYNNKKHFINMKTKIIPTLLTFTLFATPINADVIQDCKNLAKIFYKAAEYRDKGKQIIETLEYLKSTKAEDDLIFEAARNAYKNPDFPPQHVEQYRFMYCVREITQKEPWVYIEYHSKEIGDTYSIERLFEKNTIRIVMIDDSTLELWVSFSGIHKEKEIRIIIGETEYYLIDPAQSKTQTTYSLRRSINDPEAKRILNTIKDAKKIVIIKKSTVHEIENFYIEQPVEQLLSKLSPEK
ncbi:hypothetical protein ACWJJH_02240 [Endozoicomonadaceae bacterium StTr2]